MIILLVVLLVLALGGGGFGYSRFGALGMSPAALLLIILVILLLTGHLHTRRCAQRDRCVDPPRQGATDEPNHDDRRRDNQDG